MEILTTIAIGMGAVALVATTGVFLVMAWEAHRWRGIALAVALASLFYGVGLVIMRSFPEQFGP